MRSLVEVSLLFARAHVPHVLIGGHAVNMLLEPRFTADIDVTVAADMPTWSRLRGELAATGFLVEREDGETLPSGPDFARFRDAEGTILEIQAAKTKLQITAIERAIDVGGVRVATPEDLILFKAIANRAKDQIDLLGLVRLSDIDWSYVETHARDWGVTEVIARMRAAAQSTF